ncbi:unnamed protein product, partial [Boreogadus saida]
MPDESASGHSDPAPSERARPSVALPARDESYTARFASLLVHPHLRSRESDSDRATALQTYQRHATETLPRVRAHRQPP